MSFFTALSIAFNAGNGRKLAEGESDRAEEVTWSHALIGIAVLIAVQLGLLFFTGGMSYGADVLRDLAIVAFAALAAPFVIMFIASLVTKTQDRLPAAFLYLSIVLAGLQVISAVMSNFGSSSSGFLIGLLAAVSFLAAKNFLKLHWAGAVVVAILVVAAFMGAGFLLFSLPSGQLFR